MSLNNDYTFSILANDKLQGFRAEAANERLARIATEGRKPWWHRLAFGQGDSQSDKATGWSRQPKLRHQGLRIRAHHVAR